MAKIEPIISMLDKDASTTSISYVDVTVSAKQIVQVDIPKYGGSLTCYFEAILAGYYDPDLGQDTGYARLFNVTDNLAVADSEVSRAADTYGRVRSGAIILSGTKEYKIQIKCDSFIGMSIRKARVIIVCDYGSSLTSLEEQVELTNTEAYTPVSADSWKTLTDPPIFLFESAKFVPSPTFNFEACLYTASGGTAKARLMTLPDSDFNFGYEVQGPNDRYIGDILRGSKFTATRSGSAKSITVQLWNADDDAFKARCAIYDSSLNLIATTEEKTIAGYAPLVWVTFNFPSPPNLTKNSVYWLCVWGEWVSGLPTLYTRSATGDPSQALSKALNYTGTFPDPLSGVAYQNEKISIYCTVTPIIPGSEVSTTSTTPTRVRSSAISLDADEEHVVRITNGTAAKTTYITGAKLIINQSNVEKTQLRKRMAYSASSVSTVYSRLECQTYLNKANLPTITLYYEAVLKTSATSTESDLYNVTDSASIAGSERTTTSTTYVRLRSSSLTLTDLKEYDSRLKRTGASGTAYLADANIIIDIDVTVVVRVPIGDGLTWVM